MMETTISSVRIPKLLLVDTREMRHGVYNRSYTLNANAATLTRLHDTLHPSGISNKTLSTMDVINNIPGIIDLNAMPERVDIVNGWDKKRARFLMEADTMLGSTIIKTYIQGYTDYIDHAIVSCSIDPEINLYFNSLMVVSITRDPVHGNFHINKQSMFNVIPAGVSSVGYEQVDGFGNVKRLIRPEDILTSLLLIDRYSAMDTHVVNLTDKVDKTTKISKKVNNDPINYFTSVTNSFINAKNLVDSPVEDRESIMSEAKNLVLEDDITRNPFLDACYRLTGIILPSSITLRDLFIMDPSINPVYIPRANAPLQNYGEVGFMHTDDSCDTLQPTAESLKATLVANTITSYLCDNLLTSINISMTNNSGENVAVITNFNSFIDGVDMISNVNRLLSMVKCVLMPKLSDGNQVNFEIYVSADILNETVVGISLFRSPPIVFRFPTYADGLYAPIISNNTSKDLLVNDFQNILEQTYN